jgi:hypothetical protein
VWHCWHVFSESIGNVQIDSLSAKKFYHSFRLICDIYWQVFSGSIGNIQIDSLSAKKYYNFIRPICDICGIYWQVFSESIGNIQIDSLSAKKYYHFIRLMGRAASHITLECALQTHPQAALICEEVEACNMGLSDIVSQVWRRVSR